MAIPVAQRNQIKREIVSCIKEDGKPPERCITDAARSYGLTREDARELVGEIADEAEE